MPRVCSLSQTIGLGGEDEIVEDGPNQIAGKRAVSRLTITVGKFAVLDYFLVSSYTGEPRTTFLNWNAYGGGSYDWTMDRLSWTWGGLVELNQKRWAARAGYFLLPDVSNSNTFDTRVIQRGQYTAELELRYSPFGQARQAAPVRMAQPRKDGQLFRRAGRTACDFWLSPTSP